MYKYSIQLYTDRDDPNWDDVFMEQPNGNKHNRQFRIGDNSGYIARQPEQYDISSSDGSIQRDTDVLSGQLHRHGIYSKRSGKPSGYDNGTDKQYLQQCTIQLYTDRNYPNGDDVFMEHADAWRRPDGRRIRRRQQHIE